MNKYPYRDMDGEIIKVGDVILMLVSINIDNFKGFPYDTRICKKLGRELILDGMYGYTQLRYVPRSHIKKINADSNMRKIGIYFLRKQNKLKKESEYAN
jgi:hypothetical protein